MNKKHKPIVRIEQHNDEFYVVGDTYPIRRELRLLGFHWDSEKKVWCTLCWGKTKKMIEDLLKETIDCEIEENGGDKTSAN